MAKKRSNGEGSVYWSSSRKRYVAKATIGVHDGKVIRKTLYGPPGDRSNAAKLGLQAKLEPYARTQIAGNGRETVESFLKHWIEHAELRANSRATYTSLAKHIYGDAIARQRLTDVEPTDVRRFLIGLTQDGIRPPTRAKLYALLHRIFEDAVKLNLAFDNPARRVEKPRVERKRMQVLTPDQVLTFLSVAREHPLYSLFLLSLTSTMGPAEMYGLHRSDVHLEGGYVNVQSNLEDVNGKVSISETKNAFRRRRIDLPKVTIDALRQRMERHPGDLVFTSPEGGPIRRQNFRKRVWLPLLEKAAEKWREEHPGEAFPSIRLYDLRHTANAIMGYLGVPIQVASERMGHSSIKTTDDVYGHLYPSMQREVADRFDAFLAPKKANGARRDPTVTPPSRKTRTTRTL